MEKHSVSFEYIFLNKDLFKLKNISSEFSNYQLDRRFNLDRKSEKLRLKYLDL